MSTIKLKEAEFIRPDSFYCNTKLYVRKIVVHPVYRMAILSATQYETTYAGFHTQDMKIRFNHELTIELHHLDCDYIYIARRYREKLGATREHVIAITKTYLMAYLLDARLSHRMIEFLQTDGGAIEIDVLEG